MRRKVRFTVSGRGSEKARADTGKKVFLILNYVSRGVMRRERGRKDRAGAVRNSWAGSEKTVKRDSRIAMGLEEEGGVGENTCGVPHA